MASIKKNSVYPAIILCVLLASVAMGPAASGSEQEEKKTMAEAEVKEWVKVSYKGLGAEIQRIFESHLMACAVCMKEKPEHFNDPSVIHPPVRLLFDYKESNVSIEATVDINSVPQERFNPNFYNIKKMVLFRLDYCVSSFLMGIYREVYKTSPELAGQLLKRETTITVYKNKEEYWRESLLCDARNRCFVTPHAAVKVKGYDEAILQTKMERKLTYWNLGPLKDLEGNTTVNLLALKFWEVEGVNQ